MVSADVSHWLREGSTGLEHHLGIVAFLADRGIVNFRGSYLPSSLLAHPALRMTLGLPPDLRILGLKSLVHPKPAGLADPNKQGYSVAKQLLTARRGKRGQL
jgi:hypothetical protein